MALGCPGILNRRSDVISPVLKAGQFPAKAHIDGCQRIGLRFQLLFEKNLRTPKRRLRGCPGARSGLCFCHCLRPRGLTKAAKFVPGQAGEIGEIGRMIGCEAPGAQLLRHTISPHMLHGPAADGIGFGVTGRVWRIIQKNAVYTARTELERQHESRRPTAGDQHFGIGHDSTFSFTRETTLPAYTIRWIITYACSNPLQFRKVLPAPPETLNGLCLIAGIGGCRLPHHR